MSSIFWTSCGRAGRVIWPLAACLLLAALTSGCKSSSSGSGGPECDLTAGGGFGPVTRLAVAGDTGTGDAPQAQVAALMENGDSDEEYAALVLLGDLIYPDGDPDLVDEVILQPYADVLDGPTALVPVIGNHDVRLGRDDEIMEALDAPGTWYSERFGPALIVVLDSTRTDNATQREWLEEELAGATAPWIIAAMHHPPYSAGVHGSHKRTRDAFVGFFEEYGVDLVLSGHDHDYQRSEVIEDIVYVVSGAGAKLRPTGKKSFTEVSESVLHFLELEIDEEVISARAISVDGDIDEFSLCRESP